MRFNINTLHAKELDTNDLIFEGMDIRKEAVIRSAAFYDPDRYYYSIEINSLEQLQKLSRWFMDFGMDSGILIRDDTIVICYGYAE